MLRAQRCPQPNRVCDARVPTRWPGLHGRVRAVRARFHPAALLVTVLFAAGCGDDKDDQDAEATTLRTTPAVAPIDAPAPDGAEVKGTGYTFKLTGEWSDVTAQAASKGVAVPGLDRVVAAPRNGAPGATNVNVLRLAKPPGLSVDELGVSYRADHLVSGKKRITAAVPINVGGERGISYTYRTKSPDGSPLRNRQIVALRGDNAYVLTLATGPPQFSEGNRDMLSMLSSWRWSE